MEASLPDVRVTPGYRDTQDHSLLCSYNIWKHLSWGSVRCPPSPPPTTIPFTVEEDVNKTEWAAPPPPSLSGDLSLRWRRGLSQELIPEILFTKPK